MFSTSPSQRKEGDRSEKVISAGEAGGVGGQDEIVVFNECCDREHWSCSTNTVFNTFFLFDSSLESGFDFPLDLSLDLGNC